METLHVKKYNAMKIAKWDKDYNEAYASGRRWDLPQVAMYIFQKSYGYVAFDGKRALWDKTKKGVIAYWENEERLKKIRGY